MRSARQHRHGQPGNSGKYGWLPAAFLPGTIIWADSSVGSSGPQLLYQAIGASNPKLRPVRRGVVFVTWYFAGSAGCCSGYFKVSGTGTPIRSKASRWMLVGSVSIGTVAWVPAKRTWLRVRVARCSSRPRKLR
jgi:hypothetical protein